MNESAIRKSVVDSSVKEPAMGIFMGVRYVALCAVLVFANQPDTLLPNHHAPAFT